MASFTYNAGSHKLQDRTVDFVGSAAVKIMLVTDAYTPDKGHATVTAVATAEVSVSGYVGGFNGAGRKALGSKTITNDTANDRTVYDAAAPSAWTLATGETVAGAVVIWENTDDDGSIPLFFLDHTDTPTNGGTFTLAFHANGIGYTQQ